MKNKRRIILIIAFIILFLHIAHDNMILNNSYNYYLKANNLQDNKINYERFCVENNIINLD